MRWMFILPAVILFGCAATPGQLARETQRQASDTEKLAVALKGLSPGKPQDCIDLRDANDTTRIGDTILYRLGSKRLYRTDTSGGCFGLARGDILVTKSYGGRLCRGDIASTVDPGSRVESGSCVIGAFTPYVAATTPAR